jgi:glycosyltransferase involved in cell wall biosynthesis
MFDRKLVTVFLSSLRTGGAERAMLMFCSEALQKGLRVELVLCKGEGLLKELIPPGLSVVDLGCSRTIKALPKLARHLAITRPRALFTTVRNINLIAIAAAKLSGLDIPVIVRESSAPISCPKKSTLDKVAYRMLPIAYRFAHGVIAVSDGVASELISLNRSLDARIKVIPTPVVSREMLAQAEDAIDHEWFTKPDKPVVVCAARVEREKGYDTLVSAFQSLRQKIDARLVILGNGSYREQLKKNVAALGLSEHIDFLGFVVNPFPYMKRAHAFVLASEHEGLPNVLVQAMALGTPVVSTDCKSGPAEILCNGKYGRLVPVGDAAALAIALEEAITGPRLTEPQMYARTTYSAEKSTAQYLALAGIRDVTLGMTDKTLLTRGFEEPRC